MIYEPMIPHTFDWERDGIDERGAHTFNAWCNDCLEHFSGADASEITEWAKAHVCICDGCNHPFHDKHCQVGVGDGEDCSCDEAY